MALNFSICLCPPEPLSQYPCVRAQRKVGKTTPKIPRPDPPGGLDLGPIGLSYGYSLHLSPSLLVTNSWKLPQANVEGTRSFRDYLPGKTGKSSNGPHFARPDVHPNPHGIFIRRTQGSFTEAPLTDPTPTPLNTPKQT